ncbi:hypothetical protein OG413_20570 [Streptomyces sp. NBC_01433]|uniref:hypothetical protein n=1 Tax=Streptomyces sp. NBC_01433 TaxID=2903864 RepID=UPI00224F98EE|nr:hypothetical protein [Streptomyces sp. NBC_01433]MCX4677669.1 hypothetical protein [Streptomyces sp. NBC_01433]
MRTLISAGSETLTISDRPTSSYFTPLPHGLALDDVVAVRAHEVKAGDLVVALFSDGTGVRPAVHVPEAFPADPHAFADCSCRGCQECDDMDSWTFVDDSRVADVGWRFVCLAPAEDDEPCVLVLRNRPIAVIPADIVARAEQAAAPAAEERAEQAAAPAEGGRTYTVGWFSEFEVSTPREAAEAAQAQMEGYGTANSWAPVLEVIGPDGETVVIDLEDGQETPAEGGSSAGGSRVLLTLDADDRKLIARLLENAALGGALPNGSHARAERLIRRFQHQRMS